MFVTDQVCGKLLRYYAVVVGVSSKGQVQTNMRFTQATFPVTKASLFQAHRCFRIIKQRRRFVFVALTSLIIHHNYKLRYTYYPNIVKYSGVCTGQR